MFFNRLGQEPQFVLRCVSGEREGGAFALPHNRVVVIGRADGVDLPLGDTRVSRQHARVNTAGRHLILIDLGSRNGTFVNGERVRRARLKPGDQIRVGSSVFQVDTAASDGLSVPARSPVAVPPPGEAPGESGRLADTAVLELLRRWRTARRNGLASIQSSAGKIRLHLFDGHVGMAEWQGQPDYTLRKIVFRALGWTSGVYHLEAAAAGHVAPASAAAAVGLVEEAVGYLEELGRVQDQLPVPDASVLVPHPPPRDLTQLSRDERAVYDLVLKHGTLQGVMDHFPGTDLEAGRLFARLLAHELIVVV